MESETWVGYNHPFAQGRIFSPLAIIFWTLVFGISEVHAQSSAFTYEGRLFNAAGAPLLETISMRFQILNPSGNCVLYEEVQSGVDLSASKGSFSLSVGSDVGAGKRG